jgi:uncharacterized protein
MRKRSVKWTITIVVILLALWGIPRLVNFYTDWMWFKEVDFRGVFWRSFWARIGTALAFGLIFFAIVYANCALALRMAPRALWHEAEYRSRLALAYEWQKLVDRWLPTIIFIICLLAAYGVAQQAKDSWFAILMALNPSSFNQPDALFKRDLSFYVFQLPLIEMFRNYFSGALILAMILSIIVHYLARGIRTVQGVPEFAQHVKAHLSVLLALWFLVKAWDYWLMRYDLLYSMRGVVFGATYTDVNARLFALYILLVIAIVGAILVLANVRLRGIVLPLGAIAVLLVASVLASIYPAAVQRFRVVPEEQTLEKPFIDNNIAATRFGYNLIKVTDEPYPALQGYTAATLKAESPTIQNVRLWDHRPLLEVYQQKQQLQPYYQFHDVDIDRYNIGDQYRQVMLSAREINLDRLPGKGWQNEHISYTHGYGSVLSPVNEVMGEGDPRLLISDIPPISESGAPKITQPGIYYGEIATSEQFSLVKTNLEENDYNRTGSASKTTAYTGTGGVPAGGLLSRTALSARFGDINLLLSGNMTPQTRIIFRRSIAERVMAIAPFLAYDSDPYVVISRSGKQYWIQDAYTYSGRLPYSQPVMTLFPNYARFGNINYIRNSVKVVIDAYNGTTQFFIFDDKDPVLKTFANIFPGLFRPKSDMPEDLAQHIRYPEDLFNLQARINTIYHMTNVQQFYRKVDRWEIAREKRKETVIADQAQLPDMANNGEENSDGEAMKAYYVLMRLPRQTEPEFILMVPFVPLNRPNMVAWMAARCDPEHYGELITYEFPRSSQVPGPIQLESAIDQQGEISKLLTWWGQQGSTIVRGNLLVIPLGQSLLYVEPIFLKANVAPIPQLRLVVVGRQQGGSMVVSFAPTLERALATAVGTAPPLTAEDLVGVSGTATTTPEQTTPAPGPTVTPTPTPTTQQKPTTGQATPQLALQYYQAAQARLREGDFVGYQRELGKMEAVLKEMAKGK